MIDLLLEIKQEIEELPSQEKTLNPSRIDYFSQHYDQIVEEGLKHNPLKKKPKGKRGRAKQSPCRNLLDRFKKHKTEVLAFLYDTSIPFDNNKAERDIRMIKVKQKVSGSFRTNQGAAHFCSTRAYISTVKKNKQNVIHSLQQAFLGEPFLPS